MKITRIRTGVLRTPLIVPFKTAVRTVNEMTDVIIKIETDCEISGWGSAPPTGKVTGDTVGSITGAIDEMISPVMIGADVSDLEHCLDILDASLIRNTSAKAAIDIALHDIWARSVKQPAWKLFGGSGHDVETDVTISVNTPEEMAADSRRALKDGFKIIKTKVGVGPEIDFIRIKAIRDAVGSGVKIRIDANQGWKPNEAVKILNRMQDAGFDLELVEQPVKAGDLEGLAYVTANSPVPVAADESCWSAKDAMEILRRRAADMVNIKLMKCGGIRNARQIIAVSQAMGAEVMIGCMLEGKVSCAAAVHLASAYSCITRIDLDGPVLCTVDPVKGGPLFDGGPKIRLTEDPGFGVEDVLGLQWFDN